MRSIEGGIKLVQRNMTYHYSWQEGHTMYGGYAVASGHILNERSENIAVGSPNVYSKSEGYTGRVELLEYRNSNGTRLEKGDFVEIGIKRECDGLTVMDVSRDRQHGAKFGATVAAIDINDDGIDELLVGAPLYSGSYPEEGRVFIYTSKLDKLCGPVSVLSGKGAIMARFGSAIASVGDIDRDDFAIGAPYEDDGVGAVYIYRGNLDCFCNINNNYSQRISGGLYSPNTRGFGWSIYGDHDLDDNGFPDFAVGAYGSDQTIVFRTRPIIDMNGDDPEPRDAWTPVLMEVRFRVLPLPVPSFSRLDPILKDSISTILRKQIVVDAKQENRDTNPKNNKFNKTTCGEYDCITVECLVTNLGSNKETTVNVTIDVFEKALATEK
ncbi:ITA4-like protein, partial [Mya arenaria]